MSSWNNTADTDMRKVTKKENGAKKIITLHVTYISSQFAGSGRKCVLIIYF